MLLIILNFNNLVMRFDRYSLLLGLIGYSMLMEYRGVFKCRYLIGLLFICFSLEECNIWHFDRNGLIVMIMLLDRFNMLRFIEVR